MKKLILFCLVVLLVPSCADKSTAKIEWIPGVNCVNDRSGPNSILHQLPSCPDNLFVLKY